MQKIIKITEQQYNRYINGCDLLTENKHFLGEDVFIKSKNDKKGTAQLTYNQNNGGYNRGNLSSIDMLKTDKMDNNSNDTYEVPLKGGFMSYNITDINGTEVMHYFKRKFDHEKTQISLGNEKYDLEMEDSEFRNFMETFLNKVNSVVNYNINSYKKENKDINFNGISIYPVPSSSNFNEEMARRIANKHNILGLTTNIVNRDLLMKDTSNLQKDEDFINKNMDYYKDKRFKIGGNGETHLQSLNTELNKLKNLENIKQQIDIANEYTKIENRQQTGSLLKQWNYVKMKLRDGSLSDKALIKLDKLFTEYQNAVNNIEKASTYYSEITNTTHTQRLSTIASAIAYSKGPSIKGRSEEIYKLLKQNGLGKNIKKLQDVCMWKPENFQIKKLGNDIRMGLKNYFQPNDNKQIVNDELNKIGNSIVVIFDDNVSGGATLSDICMQLKNLGINYIIPITFGRMRTSYNQGQLKVINKPSNGQFNF